MDYWSPNNSEQRKQEEQQVKKWRHKEYTLQGNFKILWVFMIAVTILEIIFFEEIGVWIGTENGMIVFLVESGMFILSILIFSIVLFRIRK